MFKPFQSKSNGTIIDNLHLDSTNAQVKIEGRLLLTLDQPGFKIAQMLCEALQKIIQALPSSSDNDKKLMSPEFIPFDNASDSLQIENLTIENQTTSVSIYGEMDVLQNGDGSAGVVRLLAIVEHALVIMRAKKEMHTLPEVIAIAPSDFVDNPFMTK